MKSITKYFMAILSIVFVFVAVICVNTNINKKQPQTESPSIANNLTLNSGFTDNQYVVINGKAYSYMPSSTTQSSEYTNSIQFSSNNTLELIFLKDSITQLSNFALLDNNIASVLQATKTDNGVNINILYTELTASIETSHDAEYTLGTLALNTGNVLNYANQGFTIGAIKGATSLLDATTSATAKVLNLAGGTFQLKNTTYTGKGTGRAIYQTGGNLTLNNITLTGFSSASNGGAINSSGTLTITSGTYTGNSTSIQGGAIYSTGTLTISSATISNNTAVTGGGGLAKSGGTATLTSVTMKDNITTTTYGHAFWANNGATITVNSGTYETQNSSYKAATVIVGNATVNLVGGTFKGYNYAFDCYSANGANAKYVLKGNPTIETTSGKHFWLNADTYLRVETTLTKTYTVYKSGVTSIDDGDAATSYIAYSTNSTHLNSANSKLSVTNYQTYHQNSTDMKTNYLVCEYKSYNVTFHPNGGYRVSDNNSKPVTYSYKYKHEEGISERRRTGYTLTGYTITDTSGGSNINGATTTFDATAKTGSVKVGYADIIVKMDWTPNVYKVTLNNQSATSAGTLEYYYQYNTSKVINNITCYYYTTSACTTGLTNGYYITCPTKTGYTFGGYYTGQNGAGTQYVNASGSCVNNLFQNVASDSTLYANWTPNVYKVTLDNQGATTAGTAEYYYQYNTTKVIGGVTCYYYTTNECTTGLTNGYYISCPTKTGYTFGGYYTGQNGSGTAYVNAAGGCINNLYANVASNTTLYAKWTENTYTLTFDENSPDGSTVTQTAENIEVKYESTTNLTSSYIASCTGYAFKGYYTAASGGTQVFDNYGAIKASVSGLTNASKQWIGTSETTIYAQWIRSSYTLYFDGNSPDGSTVTQTAANIIVTYKTTTNLTSKYTASCTDYTFLGYYTDVDSGDASMLFDSDGNIQPNVAGFTDAESRWISTSNKLVYAYWQWNKYIVKFNRVNNSATGTMADQIFTKGTAQALTKNNFKLAGRKFIGWGTTSHGGVVYTDQQSVKDITSNNSITLYAQWEPITYSITFNANGGSGTMSNFSFTYGVSNQYLPKCTFTKSGYCFAGWAFDSGATVANLRDEYYLGGYYIPPGESSEITLYAVWADLSGDYGIFSPDGELLASWDYLVSASYIYVSGDTLTSATGGYNFGYDNTLIIPPTIKTIGEYAFEDCQAYDKVILPEGLTTLENSAFDYGGLSGTITIPSSVTTIGNYAFNYLPSITEYDFTQHTEIPTLGTNAFESINSNCKIYVPWNLYNSWVIATNWRTWSDYICTKEYNLVFNDVDLKLSYNSNVIGSSLNSVTVSAGDQSVTYYKVSYGQEIVINTPNRPGYTFNGWKIYRHENNEEVVISSQSFSTTFVNLTTTYQDVVIFKALWREHYYSVNVNSNGGGSIVAYINGSAHSVTSAPIYMRSGSPNIYIPYNRLIVPSYYDPITGYTYNSSATQGYVPKVVLYAERANYEFLGLYTASSGGERVATRSGLLPNTIYTDENGCWDSTSTSITLYAQWKSTVVAPPVDVINYEVVRNEAANSSKVGNIFIDYGGDSIITISSSGVTSNSFNLKENNTVMVSAEVSHKKFSIDHTGTSVNGVPPSKVTMYGIYVKIYQDTDTWRYGSPIFEKYYLNGDSTSHILGIEFSGLSDGNVIEIYPVEVVNTQSSETIQFISAEFDGTGGVASPALSLNMLGNGAPNGAEIWLDDKFRKLQEQQDTIVDFEGITF